MKVIIAGSRDITDGPTLLQAIEDSKFDITQVVCGCASGVDELGKQYAASCGIHCVLFPADWPKHGKAAGPIRNREMAEHADALIAVWDGKSRGTKNMIEEAKKRNLKVHIYIVK